MVMCVPNPTFMVMDMNFIFESDNKILIQAVQGEIQIPLEIQVLVQNITTYFDRFNNVVINRIFKQGNSVTDWVAKL